VTLPGPSTSLPLAPCPRGSARAAAALSPDGRRFEINFVDTDAQDFVRIVFDEILHETIVVDPAVTGRTTVHRSDGSPRLEGRRPRSRRKRARRAAPPSTRTAA
jgi:type II secretory pathway component GspD/PulD (secretin)